MKLIKLAIGLGAFAVLAALLSAVLTIKVNPGEIGVRANAWGSGVETTDFEPGLHLGVIGVQDKVDVFLIRHAYVRTLARRQGIGGQLLDHVTQDIDKPFLVGTWKAAIWAISFYEKHGFKDVGQQETERLLKTYWSIPTRQIETSVVLADKRWRAR